MAFLLPTFLALALLVVVSILIKEKTEIVKYLLFGGITIVVSAYTIYLVASTIIKNTQSVTKGPVHWHADFEIWNCGKRIDLIDPKGLDNKVGTPLLHEHNDGRIHVEGPVLDYKAITLGKFFEVVGGLPLKGGMVCNGELVEPQVFVYRTKNNTFYQEKIDDFENYVLSPHSQVPPGDCIIIEFDRAKDQTDKMCTFYEVAVQKGELRKR